MPNVPGDWSGVDLELELGGVAPHVGFLNDGIAYAEGELHGAARDVDDAVFLTLGTGVGGALAVGRRLLLGARGRAGELGHMLVEPDGRPCACGDRGCLETRASATAIVAEAARRVRAGAAPGLAEACGGEEARLDCPLIGAAARAGDAAAQAVLDDAGRALGVAVSIVCAVLAPQLVVVGGGAAALLDRLRPAMLEVMAGRASFLEPPPVVGGTLGDLAAAVGAAHHALAGAPR
jgi:glucokinase